MLYLGVNLVLATIFLYRRKMWLEILIDKSQKTARFITESLQFISTETETYLG